MPYYNLEEELTAADLQEFIEKWSKSFLRANRKYSI